MYFLLFLVEGIELLEVKFTFIFLYAFWKHEIFRVNGMILYEVKTYQN